MSLEIVVTPTGSDYRAAAGVSDLPGWLRADLEGLRDEIDQRFPAGDAVGETGALSERPVIEGVSVVIRPEVITRPLVVNAVMRSAARRQLLVVSPKLGLEADPRDRIDIDVHRRPTVAGAAITDHSVRGRPHGTLPWVTRDLLVGLVGALEVDGDRLEMTADADRWFHYEFTGGTLEVTVADGPDTEPMHRSVGLGDRTLAADVGWSWARRTPDWGGFFVVVTGPASAA